MTKYFPILHKKHILEAKPMIIRIIPYKTIWKIVKLEVVSKKRQFPKKHCQEKTLILKNIHRGIKYVCQNLKMENQQAN